MERTELFIYLVIFVAVVILVIRYWKTGNKG
jgi:hypothetical protein